MAAKPWMQAHPKRHDDWKLVLQVAVGLLILLGASFVPGPLPS